MPACLMLPTWRLNDETQSSIMTHDNRREEWMAVRSWIVTLNGYYVLPDYMGVTAGPFFRYRAAGTASSHPMYSSRLPGRVFGSSKGERSVLFVLLPILLAYVFLGVGSLSCLPSMALMAHMALSLLSLLPICNAAYAWSGTVDATCDLLTVRYCRFTVGAETCATIADIYVFYV